MKVAIKVMVTKRDQNILKVKKGGETFFVECSEGLKPPFYEEVNLICEARTGELKALAVEPADGNDSKGFRKEIHEIKFSRDFQGKIPHIIGKDSKGETYEIAIPEEMVDTVVRLRGRSAIVSGTATFDSCQKNKINLYNCQTVRLTATKIEFASFKRR